MQQSRADHGPLSIYPHITTRDRQLLQLLDDHLVLTTSQIHQLLFRARRTCQVRLNELRQLGLVERFRFSRPDGGSFPWHWTLGHEGQRFQAAAVGIPEPTARASRQRIVRLSANPNLAHLVTTNEFFVRLAAHARSHRDTRLRRWWSERRATQEFQKVRPDGHGLWSVGERTVGFFLECDQGTEPHNRVTAKLESYARLAAGDGPSYPVLLWLNSIEREQYLHAALRRNRSGVPIATATQDSDPAALVWLPADGFARVRLVDLPSFHGRESAANPNFRDGALHLDE